MPNVVQKLSQTAGLSPGALVHVGRIKAESTRVTVVNYDAAQATEEEIEDLEELARCNADGAVTWVAVKGIHDIDLMGQIGQVFDLHPLVMEDIVNTQQRPKYEDLGEYVFLVVKTIGYDPATDEIDPDQVSIILGKGIVISFQEKDDALFGGIRQRIINNEGRIRCMDADYLAYRLLDTVVDSYFGVLEDIEEKLGTLEDAVVTDPGPTTLQTVQGLKRGMIGLRKSVWPLREVIGAMQRRESPLIGDSTAVFMRDVYDHTIQVIDTVETLRDLISGMMDIYLSSVSNRLNEIMKVLTIISTIFIPLSFLAGVYGMNFEYFPEIKQVWGYPAFWTVALAVGCSMLLYFRRRKWL